MRLLCQNGGEIVNNATDTKLHKFQHVMGKGTCQEKEKGCEGQGREWDKFFLMWIKEGDPEMAALEKFLMK